MTEDSKKADDGCRRDDIQKCQMKESTAIVLQQQPAQND